VHEKRGRASTSVRIPKVFKTSMNDQISVKRATQLQIDLGEASPLLILGKKEEITEGRKANRVSKRKSCPLLSSIA